MKISDQISIALSVSRASVRYLIKTVKIKNDVIGERHEALSQNQSLRSCVVRLSNGENRGARNGVA